MFVLSATLLAAPANAADERIATALAARGRGDNALAIALLRAVTADAPGDADALRLLGTTLAFAHRYHEAIQVLDHARALAPRDLDIALALSRTQLWAGDLRAARRVAADAAAIAPDNAEWRELETSLGAAERDAPRVALDLAATQSRVTIGTSHRSWRETAATLAIPFDARTTVSATADVEDRSTNTDTRLTLRADRRAGWGAFYGAATITPDATFREHWSALGGVVIPLNPAITVSLEVRRAHYDLVDVTVVEPGVTLHTADSRWELTGRSVNLWGEGARHHLGWSLRGDYAPRLGLRLSAGAATYADTEAGLTRRVDSGFVGAAFPISSRLSAQIVADHENRHTSYSRNGLTVALHWRFGR